MSLPCLAFSREPFCIGAAAGRPPTAPSGRGVTRAIPLFLRPERPSGLLLVYLVVYRGQGRLSLIFKP